MFSFASKMLNTIMGNEEGVPGTGGLGGPGSGIPGQQQQQGMRPFGGGSAGAVGFPRPTQGAPGQRFGAPTFSGPRPTPSPLRGPPLFGAQTRATPGTPHRFTSAQPTPGPPVQQQARGPSPGASFGGPSPRGPQQQGTLRQQQPMPSMRQRAPQPQQATYLQHLDQPQGMGVPDLSHLSAEERAMIENVMAKAQQMEQQENVPPPGIQHHAVPGQMQQQLPQQQQMRPKDGRFMDNICPLCHTRDIREGGNECSVCRTLVCNRCGALATHPETKRPEWTCGGCIKQRRQRQQQVPSTMEWEDGGRSRQQQHGRGWADESELSNGRREDEKSSSSYLQSPGGSLTSPLSPESQHSPSMHTSTLQSKRTPAALAMRSRSLSLESEEGITSPKYGRREEDYDEEIYARRYSLTSPPSQQPQTDNKSQALMEEFTKLQSAVQSYSTKKYEPTSRFVPAERSPSPSPSPPYEDEPELMSPPQQQYQQYEQPKSQYEQPKSQYEQPKLQYEQPKSPYQQPKSSQYEQPKSQYQPTTQQYQQPQQPYQQQRLQATTSEISPYKSSPSPPTPTIEEPPSPVVSTSPLPSPISLIQSPPEGFAGSSLQFYGGVGGGSGSGTGTSKFPKERKSIVMSELDDYPSSTEESEEEEDSDDEDVKTRKKKTKRVKDDGGDYGYSVSGVGAGGSSSGGIAGAISGLSEDIMNLYQHNPGEVYTIPEEEDEGGSPTGADLVTSLSSRPTGMVGDFSGLQPNVIRPQLRPQQRQTTTTIGTSSLDNRLPSQLLQQQQPQAMQLQQPQHVIDTQGNLSYATNNNTQQQQQQATRSMQFAPQQQGDYTQQQQHPDFQPISQQQAHLQQTTQIPKSVDNLNQWNINQLGQQQQTPPQQFTSRVPTSTMDSVSMQYAPQQQQQPTTQIFDQQCQPQPLGGSNYPPQQQQVPPQTSMLQQQQQGQSYFQPSPTPSQQQQQQIQQQQQQQIQQQQMIAQQLLQNQQQLDAQAVATMQQQQQQYPQGQQSAWGTGAPGIGEAPASSPFAPLAQTQPQQYFGPGATQQSLAATGLGDQLQPLGAGGPNKSISGLIADFSRALGLGASPRPSPTDEKLDMFGLRPSPVIPTSSRPQPYDQFLQPIPQRPVDAFGLTPEQLQQQQPPIQHTLIQPAPSSAFASLGHQQQQQTGVFQQQHAQGVQFAPQAVSMQALPAHSLSDYNIVHPSLMSQQGVVVAGVGVVPGGLSPSQAYMYQQQMAMQHQQQHMKKTSRRAHFPGAIVGPGDIRRDLGSSALVVSQIPSSSGVAQLLQPLAVTPLGAGGTTPTVLTPVGTPRSGRDLGMAYDSSDTMSETDSQKSLRMRRRLPCLPADQEAAPLPSSKKRERQRAEAFRAVSPSYRIDERSFQPLSSLSRPSASESNLRKMAMEPSPAMQIQRPGSALGLLQGSSILSTVPLSQPSQIQLQAMPGGGFQLSSSLFSTSPSLLSSMRLRTTTSGYTHPTDLTTTTSVLSGLYPSYKTWDSWSSNNMAELAACLPPDLRHLLHRDTSAFGGQLTESEFPNYINQLREQLQEERRQLLADERKRLEALRERDRELGSRLTSLTSSSLARDLTAGERARAELSRNVVGLSRSAGASPILSRKHKSHRRQLSDPKLGFLAPFSPIKEDGDMTDLAVAAADPQRIGASSLLMQLRGACQPTASSFKALHAASLLNNPLSYKSYEFESLKDSSIFPPMFGEWDRSQSYLAPTTYSPSSGILRETAIGGDDSLLMLRSAQRRRKSDGEVGLLWNTAATASPRSKRHSFRKHRKSRSWHPSPYMSEEDEDDVEDLLSREEKKARIKAEIARRRQQLYKSGSASVSDFDGTRVLEGETHSVLKSVDQLLRDQYDWHYNRQAYAGLNAFGAHGVSMGGTSHSYLISPTASEEDKSIERIASTFRSPGLGISTSGLGCLSAHSQSFLLEDNGQYSGWNEDLQSMDTDSLMSELGATTAAPPMPLLPDMPTRSRRILEDLGSAPLIGGSTGTSVGAGGVGLLGSSGVRSSALGAGGILSKGMSPITIGRATFAHDKEQDVQEGSKISHAPLPPAAAPKPMSPLLVRRRSSACSLGTTTRRDSFARRRSESISEQELEQSINVAAVRTAIPTHEEEEEGSTVKATAERDQSGSEIGQQITTAVLPLPHQHLGMDREDEIRRDSQVSTIEDILFQGYTHSVISISCVRNKALFGSNDFGLKIVGGKEIPGAGGVLGAYISRLHPAFAEAHNNQIQHGDVVLECNGVSLENKTFEEVQTVFGSVEENQMTLVVRSNFDIHTGKARVGTLTNDSSNESTAPNLDDYDSSGQQQRRGSQQRRQSQPPQSQLLVYNATRLDPGHAERELRRSPSSSTVTTNEDQQLPPRPVSGGDGAALTASSVAMPTGFGLVSCAQPNNRRKRLQRKRSTSRRGGQLQLQICHDPKASILYVTVIKAKLQQPMTNAAASAIADKSFLAAKGQGLDPYIVVSLTPPRTVTNQRRTRHVPNTNTPVWNQTMVYPNVSLTELPSKTLEISVWHFTAEQQNDICVGTLTLQLADEGRTVLDERPHLYRLSKPTNNNGGTCLGGVAGGPTKKKILLPTVPAVVAASDAATAVKSGVPSE